MTLYVLNLYLITLSFSLSFFSLFFPLYIHISPLIFSLSSLHPYYTLISPLLHPYYTLIQPPTPYPLYCTPLVYPPSRSFLSIPSPSPLPYPPSLTLSTPCPTPSPCRLPPAVYATMLSSLTPYCTLLHPPSPLYTFPNCVLNNYT